MANDCIPFFEDDTRFTCKATGAIGGMHFVQLDGGRTSGPGLVADSATDKSSVYKVKQCATAGAKCFGVAAYDVAQNGLVTVIRRGVVPILAGADITAGAAVKADASGHVIPQGGTGDILGYAMSACDADVDLVAEVLLMFVAVL